MTQTTENRGYNVPEAGDTDWHEPVAFPKRATPTGTNQ